MPPPIPHHEQSIVDGGLGALPSSADGFFCKVGTSSLGTEGAFYLFRGRDVQTVFDTLGEGPLPDSVAKQLVESGGKDTLAYKCAAATPGSSTSITRSNGTDGPTLTLSGNPNNFGQYILRMVQGGERETEATFQYSGDGGDTWSDEIATAATYLLPSGVTVNFPITTATMSGSPSDVDFIAAADTIGRNTGSFTTDGFRVPMKLFIDGTASNDGDLARTLTNVATGLLTTDNGIVDESNVNAPTITGHQPYVAGETYSWTDTAPITSTGNIGTALDDIIDSVYDPEAVHVCGQASSAANSETMATLLATKRVSAWLVHKYFFVMFEAPAATRAALAAEFASFTDIATLGFGGFAEVLNDNTDAAIEKVNVGRVLSARIARQPIDIHILRDSSDVDIEPISSVRAILPDGSTDGDGYHDEARTPGLNAARFTTMMTIIGRPGYFPCNALTFAGPSSDFQELPKLRIILKVARVWYQYGLSQLAKKTQKDATTGKIRNVFADGIETKGESQIRAALGGAIEQVKCSIDRDTNLLIDPVVKTSVRVVVGDYMLVIRSSTGLAASLPAAA